ncbi:MAG: MFS transporter, partial [Gemmataceae bacterium]
VFPMHLRGTGSSFATNVGGRMIGTMAATFNTVLLSKAFGGGPEGVALAAAAIGGTVYFIAFIASFFLPTPAEAPVAE